MSHAVFTDYVCMDLSVMAVVVLGGINFVSIFCAERYRMVREACP